MAFSHDITTAEKQSVLTGYTILRRGMRNEIVWNNINECGEHFALTHRHFALTLTRRLDDIEIICVIEV